MGNVRFIFCLCLFLVTLQIESIHSDTQPSSQPQLPPDSIIRGSGREEIAFADRGNRHDLYRRYENRNNWDYRQNWEHHQDAYLRGDMSLEEGPTPPSYYQNQSYQNYYNDRPVQSYENYRDNYNDPNPRSLPRKSWDYRQNWRYYQDAYLRGDNPTAYRKKLQDEQEKRKLAREQQAKQRKEQQEKYLAELARKKSNNTTNNNTIKSNTTYTSNNNSTQNNNQNSRQQNKYSTTNTSALPYNSNNYHYPILVDFQ